MGSDISRPQQQNSFAKRRSSKRMSRRLSMGPPAPARGDEQKPPSIRVGGSTGKLAVEDNENEVQYTGSQSSRLSLSIDQLNTPRSRSGSSSSQSPTKPTTKHRSSLSLKNRQLIQSCFNNPHENIGCRILKRAAERRKDFGRFYMAVTVEQRDQIADTIKMLLKKSVSCIDNADDELQILAIEFGQRFVDYRLHGFKADYFAALADATITECVLLDAAVHPAAVTLNAFSQFITMLFSSVRDGFYTEMRRLRRISNSFSTVSNGSVSRKKLSVEDALKSIERSPPISGSSGKSANSNTEIRRGSTGTVGNRSPNGSPRSLSPAEGKMSQSKSASPFEASSHDSEQLLVEQNNISKKNSSGKKRGSKSPSPRRKISPGSASNSSYGGQKAKEELKQITAEFLNSGAIGTTFGGKENADEKPTRMAAAVAN